MDRSRLCARPGCGAPAAATLTYQYAGRAVWIDDLEGERPQGGYDLCMAHADGLTVPVGWAREDRRGRVVPIRPSIAV